MLNLSDFGIFTFIYEEDFFVETDKGNYIWSNPYYGGNNEITSFNGDIKDWLNSKENVNSINKGRHKILSYCGKDVKIEE